MGSQWKLGGWEALEEGLNPRQIEHWPQGLQPIFNLWWHFTRVDSTTNGIFSRPFIGGPFGHGSPLWSEKSTMAIGENRKMIWSLVEAWVARHERATLWNPIYANVYIDQSPSGSCPSRGHWASVCWPQALPCINQLQSRLGKKQHWNLGTSSAAVEFPPLYLKII